MKVLVEKRLLQESKHQKLMTKNKMPENEKKGLFFFNAVCLMLNADRNTREYEKEVNEGSRKVKNC